MGDRTTYGAVSLKERRFKFGLVNNPTCNRCQRESNTAYVTLGLSSHTILSPWTHFMAPDDHLDAPLSKSTTLFELWYC